MIVAIFAQSTRSEGGFASHYMHKNVTANDSPRHGYFRNSFDPEVAIGSTHTKLYNDTSSAESHWSHNSIT